MVLPDPNSAQQPSAGSLWRDTLAAHTEFSTGFDGILLFVAVTRVLSPVLVGYTFHFYLSTLIQPPVWNALINSGYPDPYWLVAIEAGTGTISTAVTVLFDLVLLWLFFRRRRAFRGAVIAFYLLNMAWPLAILALSFMFGSLNTDAIFYTGIISMWALPWMAYFLFSQRVRNTFVR